MGAAIDLLIQARSNGDAAAMHNISQALWNVWHAFTYVDTEESDMVYGGHSTSPEMSDTPIRLWLELYNAYNVD